MKPWSETQNKNMVVKEDLEYNDL